MNFANRPADQLLFREARALERTPPGHAVRQVLADDEHGNRRRIDNGVQERRAGPRRLLRLAAAGHVVRVEDERMQPRVSHAITAAALEPAPGAVRVPKPNDYGEGLQV
jgi:hypothetical protein